MTKAFFDAFPTVMPEDEELSSLLEHTTVTKVAVSEKRAQLRIYLDADRLIGKKDLEKVEKTFDEEFASGQGLKTKIIEHFHLSGQYTPKNLMRAYRSSILYELQGYQKCIYTMFRGADLHFSDEETCIVTVEDNLVSRSYAQELKRILDKIFTERFGLNFRCTVDFCKSDPAEDFVPLPKSVGMQKEDSSAAPLQQKEDPPAAPLQQAEDAGSKKRTLSGGRRRYSKKGQGSSQDRALKLSSNPDVVYGRDFSDDAVPIDSITEAIGTVTIRGEVISLEPRQIHTRAGKDLTIILMNVTDYTDTMSVKLFIDAAQSEEFLSSVKTGMFLKIKGSASVDRFDGDLSVGSVAGMKKIADFRPHRIDDAPVKRVELHCHTKMSRMDAVCDVKEIVKTAMQWGHSAIAITDHGGVQALPDAWHAVPKDSDFKVIYGCEAYLVDDEALAVTGAKEGQLFSGSYVVFDLETTGFSPVNDRIIEIGAVKIEDGKIVERFSEFVNPLRPIPFRIEQLTSQCIL